MTGTGDLTGYRTFFTTVSTVADVGPNLREVTFAGGDLADRFAPVGPDTFLYLLLPPPGRTELTIDSSFSWEGVWEMPEAERPVGGYYTLRRWRPDVAELDIWMVLHDGGDACAWALDVEPGRPVALWGPRTAWAPPEDTTHYVLVADDTGLPAVEVILETLPAGTPVQVIIEVDGPAFERDLPVSEHVEVSWLHRNGAATGTTTLLVDAVRALAVPQVPTYVWGGAESRAMTGVRRHVRTDWGLIREQVSLVGYWRHQDHVADPVDPED